MTGWTGAITVIALMLVAVAAFNLALWRRMKAAIAARANWTAADFHRALAADGIAPDVAAAVLDLLQPAYPAGAVPHPDDDLIRFVALDERRIAAIVAAALLRLSLPVPAAGAPEGLPGIRTPRALAAHLHRLARARPAYSR